MKYNKASIIKSMKNHKLSIIAFLFLSIGIDFIMTFTGREEFVGGITGLVLILIGIILTLIKIAMVLYTKFK